LPISNLPDDADAGFDASEFDLYPFSFQTRSINKTYEFTLRISDGKDQNLRTFSMFVVSRDSLTADTTDFTADSELLTAQIYHHSALLLLPIIQQPIRHTQQDLLACLDTTISLHIKFWDWILMGTHLNLKLNLVTAVTFHLDWCLIDLQDG
jgi:hypothetical protein